MFDWRSGDEWKRLWRYYQAGIVNLMFGFGLYAIFVRLGMNIYVAQIVSHVIGMIFNYFTYSRYTFAGDNSSKVRFVLSYGLNYLLSLVTLTIVSLIVRSPYLAGLIAAIVVSVVNFFILKKFVFTNRVAQ